MTSIRMHSKGIERRAFIGLLLVLAACKKNERPRCGACGMLVDSKSAFAVEVVGAAGTTWFDTPRCALSSLRKGKANGVLRVQEFYTRDPLDGASVRYVAGSDVEGPMGPELVPVAPDKVDKFVRDHGAGRARIYSLDQITNEVLAKEGAP